MMSSAEANLTVIMALSNIRQYILANYDACGGISALIALNGVESRILAAIEEEAGE